LGKTYYELLDLPVTATIADIKRNFRREIAKYHPDKVQHLGKEFQDIAAVKAAELTQAYKTLSDATQRAEYDALLRDGDQPGASARSAPPGAPPSQSAPQRQESPRPPAHDFTPSAPSGSSAFSQDRAASSDLIERATKARFRHAVTAEFGSVEAVPPQGFELAAIPRPPFWKLKLPPIVLGRFVPQVDAAAVAEAWTLAGRMKKESQRDLVVFLMGPAVAPPGELAAAIAEQRKKLMPAGGTLTLVPVNTRNWHAHVPTDAPAVVKSLLTRLKSA
jgi:hypothetical protein